MSTNIEMFLQICMDCCVASDMYVPTCMCMRVLCVYVCACVLRVRSCVRCVCACDVRVYARVLIENFNPGRGMKTFAPICGSVWELCITPLPLNSIPKNSPHNLKFKNKIPLLTKCRQPIVPNPCYNPIKGNLSD